jgi:hypothetical protein
VRRIKAYDQQQQILLSEYCVRQFAETSEKILLPRGPETIHFIDYFKTPTTNETRILSGGRSA